MLYSCISMMKAHILCIVMQDLNVFGHYNLKMELRNIFFIVLLLFIWGLQADQQGNSQDKPTATVSLSPKENTFDRENLQLDKQDEPNTKTAQIHQKVEEEPHQKQQQKKQQEIVVIAGKQDQKDAQKIVQVEQKKIEQVEQKEAQKAVQIEHHEVLIPTIITADDPQAKAQHTLQQEQIQISKYNEQLMDKQSKIKPWIASQIQNSEIARNGLVYQSFQFVLPQYEEYIFRWNPPKNDKLQLSVTVYEVTSSGQIISYEKSERQDYILVEYKDENNNLFLQIGKVYFFRVFSINFDTDYKYFRFTNKIGVTVCVVVDLQRLQQTVSKLQVAVDDHFAVPLKKIEIIEEEVLNQQKLREHTYKWQWGFLENHYHHESSMLGFTGVQLFIIMGSTLTQLYFIKTLLDNRAVV